MSHDALDSREVNAKRLHLADIGMSAAVRCKQPNLWDCFQSFSELIAEVGGIAGLIHLTGFPDVLPVCLSQRHRAVPQTFGNGDVPVTVSGFDLANFVLSAARLLSDNNPQNVQVKTTLHSPGDVILQIWNFAQENALPLLMCYVAIFGGKAGDYEFNSLIGVIKSLINHKHDKEKQALEMRKFAAEADLAEQEALGKKLENMERMRQLRLSTVEECVEALAEASKNLEITPSKGTIIDITKILEAQKEDGSSK